MVVGNVIKIHLIRYLTGKRVPPRIESIFSRYNGLRRIRGRILKGECPICGKRFSTLQGLQAHLNGSPCSYFFSLSIDSIIIYLYEKELNSKHREVTYDNVAKLLNEEIERYLVH